MVEQERAAKIAATSSTVAAALGLANLLKGTPAQAQYGFPPELLELLAAMAQVQLQILAELEAIQAGPAIQGYPKNANAIDVIRVICTIPLQPYQLPKMLIRDGFALAIEADVGNIAQVCIARSPGNTADPNHSKPISPGLSAMYYVNDASNLWVRGTVANDSIIISVEAD